MANCDCGGEHRVYKKCGHISNSKDRYQLMIHCGQCNVASRSDLKMMFIDMLEHGGIGSSLSLCLGVMGHVIDGTKCEKTRKVLKMALADIIPQINNTGMMDVEVELKNGEVIR